MNSNFRLNKPVVIFGLVLTLVSLIAFYLYYTFLVFHIVAVDPRNNVLPTSQSNIQVDFNFAIDKSDNDAGKITLSSDIPYEVQIKDKRLTISLDFTNSTINRLDVNLNGIKSNDGKKLSKKLSFERKYVPLKNQTQAENERQINQSDSFENDFPLIKNLPFMNDTFNIQYEYPGTYDTKMKIIVSNLLLGDDPTAGTDSQSYLNSLRTSRTAAIDWLNRNGFNKEKYDLYFVEPQLVDEFGGSYYANSLEQVDD